MKLTNLVAGCALAAIVATASSVVVHAQGYPSAGVYMSYYNGPCTSGTWINHQVCQEWDTTTGQHSGLWVYWVENQAVTVDYETCLDVTLPNTYGFKHGIKIGWCSQTGTHH